MAARARSGTQKKPRSDAYVGLLILALLAQITGAVFLFLDYNDYKGAVPKPPTVQAPPPAASSNQPPGGGGPMGGGPMGGGPMGGGPPMQ
jgi:hypothetical protein